MISVFCQFSVVCVFSFCCVLMSFYFFLTYIFKESFSLFIVICTSILCCCCCCCRIADVKLRVWKAELLFISQLHQTIEEFRVERLEGFVVSQLFYVEEAVSYSINLLVSQSVCQKVSWPVCQPLSLLASLPASQSVSLSSQPITQPVSRPSTDQSIRSVNSVSHSLSVPFPPSPPRNPCDPLLVVMDSFTYGRVAILPQAHKHHCVHGVGVGCLFFCLFSQELA